jgi:hypothetical protein
MRKATYVGIISTALALSASCLAAQMSNDGSQLVAATAELQTTIDAGSAKAGDVVTAKLTESIRIPGGGELRRNTVLTGHIDQVESADNGGVSTVVLTFDAAQSKNGQPIAVKSTIVGIYPNGTEIVSPDLNPHLTIQQEPNGRHGYSLSSSVEGSNSGVLKANGKNVHLVNGTELEFLVSPGGSGSTVTGNS